MRGLPNEQLREKVSELMFLKLGIDMARTDTQYPLLPASDRDKFLDGIMDILAFQRQAILKEVREGVIGEDDKPTPIQRKMIGGLTVTDSARNYLRAEQRIKLDAMERQS